MRFRTIAVVAPILLATATLFGAERPTLERDFQDPPDQAKPRVYWWWLNSVISERGITRDLEEMKRMGVGGAMIFDAGMPAGPTPVGPRFMGPEWRKMFQHAVAEADRLGLEISLNLCSGWDSGGPWVTPEHASQRLCWSEISVEGPCDLSQVLPLPREVSIGADAVPLYYRDVAVQAFRADKSRIGSMAAAAPALRASSGKDISPAAPRNAVDGDSATFWVSHGIRPGEGPTVDRPQWLELEFSEPYRATGLFLLGRESFGPRWCELQCSEDGKTYRRICRFQVADGQPLTMAFDETTSRWFRLLITAAYDVGSSRPSRNVQIREFCLLKQKEQYVERFPIKNWRAKSGYQSISGGLLPGTLQQHAPSVPGEVDLESGELVDLSEKTDQSGHLRWKVPPGRWCILRIGHTLTGTQVICSSPGGEGHMLDFLSVQATDLQFHSMATPLLEDVGSLVGKSLRYFHDDSWEVGSPNWTVRFPEEFKRRRGYDLRPYLPVLAGKIVDSRVISNRFLWDFRKTIGDCIAENHYGRLRDLSHRHELGVHSESGGPFFPHIDALKCLGKNDIPMGEFWCAAAEPEQSVPLRGTFRVCDTVKQAASAAHIYGRKYVQAEAFTSMGPHWEKTPFDLKDNADHAFCRGLNRVMCHTFTHSPIDYGKPGIEYFAGTHFNPNITWWDQSHAWLGYLARCQHLLQQGLFVADLCYFYGEDVPNFVPGKTHMRPPLPNGFDCDTINADVLLNRMSVKNGRLVLPDGMSYRLLVLPERQTLSPKVLRKIRQLVEAGATVVGPKPERAPGLTNYPQSDVDVRKLANELWGDVDGQRVKERAFGQGRIVYGQSLQVILAGQGVSQDFEYRSAAQDTQLEFIHRTCETAEIYFVSNQKNRSENVDCFFRVTGKQPEIWDAVTGEYWNASDFRQQDGRTVVPLEFAPKQSWFVIFRTPARESRKGSSNCPVLTPIGELSGSWAVRFDSKWGGPESVVFENLDDWTKRPEAGIKYYSGESTYSKTFDLPEAARGRDERLYLDLGRVEDIAEVRLNGHQLGVVWTAPWRVEITQAVQSMGNRLEIDVVNLWVNRLVGDSALPPEKRLTATNVKKFKPDSPLVESGLLGPVTLQAAARGAKYE